MLYEYCSNIPQIPKEILNQLTEESIRQIPNRFNGQPITDNPKPKYSLHTVTQDLETFLKPHFPEEINIAFQLITEDLPIHKDYGRSSCYNYIVELGGSVTTVWYNDNLEEIGSTIFPAKVWHKIDVGTFHTVKGVTSTRLAISVWTKNEDAIGEIVN